MILAAFHRANKFDPVFTDLDILLLLLFSVEIVSPEGTLVGIYLMVPPTIGALEGVKFAVVLGLVRAITFNAFGILNSA